MLLHRLDSFCSAEEFSKIFLGPDHADNTGVVKHMILITASILPGQFSQCYFFKKFDRFRGMIEILLIATSKISFPEIAKVHLTPDEINGAPLHSPP